MRSTRGSEPEKRERDLRQVRDSRTAYRDTMRVLVACECSGVVRDAFQAQGHDAWSCDLQSSSGPHIQRDVREVLGDDWDLMIAHPPCTYLTVTGNRWMKPEYRDRFPDREAQRTAAVGFFLELANAPIDRVAVENPVGIMSRLFRKPDQIIQPWHFGDRATKTTCLWLRGLPPLLAMTEVAGRGERVLYASGKSHAKWYADAVKLDPLERANVRSKTFPKIALAMADQWGQA